MRRYDELPPMKRRRPSKVIQEEVDPVHMHDVGVANVPDCGECDRISCRANIGNSDDLNTIELLELWQAVCAWCVEDVVQCDDADAVALINLSRCERFDNALQAADGRMELAHDMNNLHDNGCAPTVAETNDPAVGFLLAIKQELTLKLRPSNRRIHKSP